MNSPRALLVISGRMFGGGQRVVLDILKAFFGGGSVRAELCLLGGSGEQYEEFGGVTLRYDGRYNRLGSLLTTVRALRKLLDSVRPDILHSHGWDASLIVAMALVGRDVPHLVHVHTCDDWLEFATVKHAIRRSITRWVWRRPSTTVIAVCDAVRHHWEAELGSDIVPVRVLHNCVDSDSFRPRQAKSAACGPLTVGVATRLNSGKGIEDLFSAFELLGRGGCVPRLLIAGDGPLRSSLGERARSSFPDGRVVFLGFIRETPDFYRGLDLAVVPSWNEGLPLTVLEAMSCGVPVVATDVGGVREVVRSGVDGIVVPPHRPDLLAEGISAILADDNRRSGMGTSARGRILDRFTLTAYSEKLQEVYLDSIAAAGLSRDRNVA